MATQYWYFLVCGPIDNTTGLMTSLYAYGQHCGDALANALRAATDELCITKPEVTEATRLDTLHDFEEPDNLVQLSELVYSWHENYSYPLATESDFIPPTGIVKSTDEGADYSLIKNAFVALQDSTDGSFTFELVANKNKLADTFLQSIKFISLPIRLEICIKGHWQNQKSELWAIDTSTLPGNVATFLIENEANIIENGFVECTIVTDAGITKLTLDEHKKILLQCTDQEVFNKFGLTIMKLGFEQTTELHSLEHNFYHWHYRPAQSLDAPELRLLLIDAGFSFIKSWDDEDDIKYQTSED